MAKIRNRSGEERDVPGFGTVPADGIIEVPEAALYGFTCQGIWEPVRKADQEAHDKAVADERARVGAAVAAAAVVPESNA